MKLEKIKINGRYYLENNELYLFNCGSGISFVFKGKSFDISLSSKPQPCYYYLIIDRDYDNKIKCSTLNGEKYTYSFNDNKEHLLDIVKANEANDNTLIIKELSVNGELLEYDHHYDKKVMIYGDSTVAGYGILSHNEASIHTSDGVQDFVYHALYELNYDMDIICASGYGLLFSAYTNPKTIGISDYIDKVAVRYDYPWVNKRNDDILILSIGCNDASYIREQTKNKEELVKKVIDAYQALIERHLKLNNDLKILMVYGTLKEEIAYYIFEQAFEYLKPLYKNLYIHKFNGDNSGASNHAYATAHENMTEELKKVIKSIL